MGRREFSDDRENERREAQTTLPRTRGWPDDTKPYSEHLHIENMFAKLEDRFALCLEEDV